MRRVGKLLKWLGIGIAILIAAEGRSAEPGARRNC